MKILVYIACFFVSLHTVAQTVTCDDKAIERAFGLALKIVDANTRNGILAAGADYGGEWTRDISINSWNAASLLRPAVASQSLWSVTINKDTIGHQYWDKIIWVVAAYNHYVITGDKDFLAKAYTCAANTMAQLEKTAFDRQYNLFTGPSVFNDGIAGYPPPIFEAGNNSSFVLDHKGADKIKCLSTNCIYYGAYISLLQMQQALRLTGAITGYKTRAAKLKTSILKYFYNSKQHTLNYLIDQNGTVDQSREALGISFAVIFGIVKGEDAKQLIKHATVSAHGITSIYPDFARYSADKPGRHNNIVWPMASGFFSQAALISGNYSTFSRELQNLTHLALDADKGNGDFKEIYNPYTGKPDGGWQANGSIPDFHWTSCKAQTWSATAYISMLLHGLIGLQFGEQSISFAPYLPNDIHHVTINKLFFRDALLTIDIKGSGKKIKTFTIDGKQQREYTFSTTMKGEHRIEINVE